MVLQIYNIIFKQVICTNFSHDPGFIWEIAVHIFLPRYLALKSNPEFHFKEFDYTPINLVTCNWYWIKKNI